MGRGICEVARDSRGQEADGFGDFLKSEGFQDGEGREGCAWRWLEVRVDE